MSRDLADYHEQYSKHRYERYQVMFRKRKLREILGQYPHHKLLEVGCGLEPIFHDINTFSKLVIVEPAKMFFDKATEDAATTENRDITVINSFLEDEETRLARHGFDFIIVSSLLHEIQDQQRFLQTLYNISGDNTTIHINVPNAISFHRLLALEMGLIDSVYEKSDSNIQLQQFSVFDIEMLTNMVVNSGFEVIETGAYAFKPFTHNQMQQMIDSGLINEGLLDGLYNMEKYMGKYCSEIYVNLKKK